MTNKKIEVFAADSWRDVFKSHKTKYISVSCLIIGKKKLKTLVIFQGSDTFGVTSTLSQKDDYNLEEMYGSPHPLNVWMSPNAIS